MPAEDKFSEYRPGLNSPLTGVFTVTPSDDSDLPFVTRTFQVTTAGDVAVIMQDGSTDIIPGCVPGIPYPYRVSRVLQAGTDATGIKGFY